MEREVKFHIANKRNGDESGEGTTVNMSSSGILFTSERPLIPGRRVNLSISWPAQLDSKCALKLVARGRVVRCNDRNIAVEIEQHEFRTAGRVGSDVQ